MIAVDQPLTLAPDARLLSVSQLPRAWRQRFGAHADDRVLGKDGGRTTALLVSASTADLLDELKNSSSLVDAVVRFAERRQLDPGDVLDGAWPTVEKMMRLGLLRGDVHAPDDADIAPTLLTRGSLIGGLAGTDLASTDLAGTDLAGTDLAGTEASAIVVRSLHVAAGGEVYLVQLAAGGFGVLKLERRDAGIGSALHEAAILGRLADCPFTPRVISSGTLACGRWLLLPWCSGSNAAIAGRTARAEGRESTLELLRAVAHAYADLHRHCVLHGDVHAGNVLVNADGGVTLIDFALATAAGQPSPTPRAGVATALEPEYARALLADDDLTADDPVADDPAADDPAVAASPAGEQYAVGSLLFQIATGQPPLDLSLDRRTLWQQVAQTKVRGFAELGVRPWPKLEEVLGRALARQPEARYGNLDALAAALADMAPCSPTRRSRPLAFDDAASQGASPETPSGVSIYAGTTGMALLSLHRGDLEAATRWLDPVNRVDTATSAHRISPFHGASGVAVVRAMLAHRCNREVERLRYIDHFIDVCDDLLSDPAREEAPRLDLTLGWAGNLLMCAELIDLLPAPHPRLLDLGQRLNRLVAADGPLIAERCEGYVGMAHGLAGGLFALLRFAAATYRLPEPRLQDALSYLASHAEPLGRGLAWPVNVASPVPSSDEESDSRGHANRHRADWCHTGWCHGSAGHVHLWGLAYRALGDRRYLDLATGAAWHTWESRWSALPLGPPPSGSLCCGLLGRARAMIAHARVFEYSNPQQLQQRRLWLRRARRLAEAAVDADFTTPRQHLFKGRAALALIGPELRVQRPLFGMI